MAHKKRWFRFYIDQWFKGSFGLSPNEVAAYITILCELYDNDGIVALDTEVMARRCGMRPTSFQKALDGLIERRKVFLEAGFLTQNAVAEEIKSREKLGEKSAESRANRAEKSSQFKGNVKKDTPYKEERIKNTSFFDVPQIGGVEGALARKAQRQGRMHS